MLKFIYSMLWISCYSKKKCYCAEGDGTFIGMSEKDEGVCCFCHIIKQLKKEVKTNGN